MTTNDYMRGRMLKDTLNYRTSMQTISDLLTATSDSGQDGIRTTKLLTKVNISYSRLSKFMGNLTGSGLVSKIESDGKNTFAITEKGRTYLETYTKFANIAESYGLEI